MNTTAVDHLKVRLEAVENNRGVAIAEGDYDTADRLKQEASDLKQGIEYLTVDAIDRDQVPDALCFGPLTDAEVEELLKKVLGPLEDEEPSLTEEEEELILKALRHYRVSLSHFSDADNRIIEVSELIKKFKA